MGQDGCNPEHHFGTGHTQALVSRFPKATSKPTQIPHKSSRLSIIIFSRVSALQLIFIVGLTVSHSTRQ